MAEPLFVAELRVRGNVSFGKTGQKQLQSTGDGTPAFNFSVGVNHSKLNSATGEYTPDGTTWIQVACYGNLAKKAFAQLSTGSLVEVSGPVRARSYTTVNGSGTAFQITSASSISLSIMGKLEETNAQTVAPMPTAEVAPDLAELGI